MKASVTALDGDAGEQVEDILDFGVFLFLSVDIEDDVTFIHHNEP